MIDASWWHALAGGALIGLASGGLMLLNGRIAGVSGVFHRAVEGNRDGWRWAFLAGLILSGTAAYLLAPAGVVANAAAGAGSGGASIAMAIAAGLLVGIGTRMGSGCTSGHGICGLARLSPRSLVAVLVFLVTGMLVTAALRWLGGV